MQPMTATRPQAAIPRRDPAPSRTAYKMHRLWLTPVFRALFRVGLPVFLALLAGGWFLSDPANRAAISDKSNEIRRSVEERPEFMVKLMAVEGATPPVDQAIRSILPIDFPISSFDLDLEQMKAEVAKLDVIESVDLRIRPGGVLEVRLRERVPAVVWRTQSGLEILDATGHRIASLSARAGRADLPLLAGAGAAEKVPEALSLLKIVTPIMPRLRGLVRVGERRWDVVLEHNQRILLPEQNPVSALQQILALDQAQDLLARDITVIDMRNPLRPTLRIAPPAIEELRRIRGLELGDS